MTQSEMLNGRHRRALVLACLLGQTLAFQPSLTPQTLKQAARRNLRLKESPSSSSSLDGGEDPLSANHAEAGENTAANDDIAKSLFLENSQENLSIAKDIFEAEAQFLGANDTSTSVGVLEKITLEDDSSSLGPTSSSDSVVDLAESGFQSSVDVVLAASEAAAVAAEATLTKDMADQLAPFGSIDQQELENSAVIPLATENQEDSDRTASADEESLVAPSVARILKFAIPATGVWLCDPLLSLIDTSAVGVLSGTIQQAALNPATAVVDYVALMIAFLYTATTNLIAAAKESDRGVEGAPKTTNNFVGSIQLSTWVGSAAGLLLFIFAKQSIYAIAGDGVADPAVFQAATRYVQIRALGMPLAAIIGSAQAACLGMQDIKSQFIILSVAAVVNFLGDMIFVGSSNPWIGGAAGAAWATVFSQFAAVALFAQWLCHKPKNQQTKTAVNLSQPILELTGDSTGPSNRVRQNKFRSALSSIGRLGRKRKEKEPEAAGQYKSQSVRGFLGGRSRKRDLWKLPSKSIIKAFSPYFLPVTSAQIGRISAYVAMSYVVASSLGTKAMAAQQIICSLVYSLFPLADSLSLTGQSFVPGIMEKPASPDRAAVLQKTMLNLAKGALILSFAMVGAAGCIPIISSSLTSDASVAGMVNHVVPFLAANFPFYALAMALEGFLLGRKDLGFQGKMYSTFCFIIPYFMLRVRSAALTGSKIAGLAGVWKVMLGYQVLRFVSWFARFVFLQRQTAKESTKAAPV